MGKHVLIRPKSNNIPKGTHTKHTYVFDSDFSSFFQKLPKKPISFAKFISRKRKKEKCLANEH